MFLRSSLCDSLCNDKVSDMTRNLGTQLLYEYDDIAYGIHIKVWMDLFTMQVFSTEHPLK